VAQAKEANVTLVIENIHDKNSGPLLALIRSFETEFVRSSIDIGHAYIKQLDGGPTPDQWVRESGPLLAHLHLQDTDGHIDRHWHPGVGAINWFALFEALATLEQKPRLLLEIRPKEAVQVAAKWFEERGLAR
ncbi:MAG TPA: TIM barrel protein, partial [Caldilineaceae bacterium]|nr:TIM barrel protein [Caldilineaceae bacterium]